jgi:DNA-binding transcriptional LysR family regulator
MNKNERSLLSADLLRTFVAIADYSNLTIAAGRLHRTQSAISVQLRKLETDLRVALFDRTSKGMMLTDAGVKLLPKARFILAELKQASILFETPLTGFIRVGIPDDFNDTMLERILAEFSFSYPDVDVEAISGCTSTYPAAIRDDEMDIAVCSGTNIEEGEALDVEEIVWAAKKEMKITSKQPVPLAILDRNCWWRNLPIDALNSIGRDYKVAFRSSNFASLRAAIRAGFAIGTLPVSCVDEGMTVLSKVEGFPDLPNSKRVILVGNNIRSDLAKAMVGAIRNAREERYSFDN